MKNRLVGWVAWSVLAGTLGCGEGDAAAPPNDGSPSVASDRGPDTDAALDAALDATLDAARDRPDCALGDWTGSTSRTLTLACSPYHFEAPLQVDGDATLTIEAGVELRFAAGTSLSVGYGPGKLVALGTPTLPIVFTSSQAAPTLGSWSGLYFGEETLSGSAISHAIVSYAGEPGDDLDACVTIRVALPGRLAIDHTLFEGCRTAAVSNNSAGFRFQSFTANTFKDCDSGLYLDSNTIGSVQAAQTYTNTPRNRVTEGPVTRSVDWAGQPVPWVFDGALEIEDVEDSNHPILTLEAGNTLQFASGAAVSVGYYAGGGLVANGTAAEPVTFESSQPGATPGSWAGIGLWENTAATSRLNYAIIRHAGQPVSIYRGGLTCGSAHSLVMPIENTTFELNARVDVSLCDCPLVTEAGNTYSSGGFDRDDCD